MSFDLVNYSQNDPAWKTVKIGSSGETIGHVGCAVASVAMLLSGHGFVETPKTLNKKLKERSGYVGAAIIWGAVTAIYPQVVYRNLVLCRNTDAPLAQIDSSIAGGQPVLVEVDSSPNPGLQTHWVVLYKKKGGDYLMLDPWPYPTESGQEITLSSRYSHGLPLKKAISAVVFYEGMTSGGDGSSPDVPAEPGTYVKIPVSVAAGLRFRSGPTTASSTIAILPPGTLLRLLDPGEVSRIGGYGQWVHVEDSQDRQGYVAAWYVEAGPVVSGDGPPDEPEEPEEPVEPDEPVEPEEPVEPDEPETLTLYVSPSVGVAGLRLRSAPSFGGSLVTVLKAARPLTVLEPADSARSKIGVAGSWIHVIDGERNQGYVAGNFVVLELEGEPEPAPPPGELSVHVMSAALAGLRMRSEPNYLVSSTIKILKANTQLTVLEGSADMVGHINKWLRVRDPEGDEGYVAAWWVRL